MWLSSPMENTLSQEVRIPQRAFGMLPQVKPCIFSQAIASHYTSGFFSGREICSHRQRDRTARLWDAATGKQVRVFDNPEIVSAVAYSPDGKYVAIGCEDRVVRIWEVSTGQMVREFLGADALGIKFSPDGRFLLTGGADRTAPLWDLATGKAIRSFTGHAAAVQTVTFSPDGNQVVTISNDGIVRVWSLQTASIGIQFIGHEANLRQARSPRTANNRYCRYGWHRSYMEPPDRSNHGHADWTHR